MLLSFWLKELQDLVRHFFVRRQCVKVRARRRGYNRFMEFLRSELLTRFRLGKVQRRRFRGERKAIALFENGNIIESLFAGVADFQKIGFEQKNSLRKKFCQRSMEIPAEWRA